MPIVNPTQVVAGTTIDASDVNTPIDQIANLVNGNLDSANIASLDATRLTGTIQPNNFGDGSILPGKIKFSDAVSGNSISLGQLVIQWGTSTVTMNGTAANSFGHTIVSLPIAMASGYIAVGAPSDPGTTNQAKFGINVNSPTQIDLIYGTGAATNTASITVKWMVIGMAA